MTANMYVSLLVDEDNRHEPMAGFLDGDPSKGVVVCAVDIDVLGRDADAEHSGRFCITSYNPEAFNVLAAVLVKAADMATALYAEVTA